MNAVGSISTPEDVALQAARLLLEEVQRGGCVDSKHQWLILLLMTLGKEDVGKCLMGRLTAHRCDALYRHLEHADEKHSVPARFGYVLWYEIQDSGPGTDIGRGNDELHGHRIQ